MYETLNESVFYSYVVTVNQTNVELYNSRSDFQDFF